MKTQMLKTLLTLIVLFVTSTAFALDEAEIKASDLTPADQATFLYRLQDPDTDQAKLAEEFKTASEAATEAKEKAADDERFKPIYDGVIEFIKPITTIDECIKRLPFYFNTASIENDDQHRILDELTKRWSNKYQLSSGTKSDDIATRLSLLQTSLDQNRALDARITARFKGMTQYDAAGNDRALTNLFLTATSAINERIDQLERQAKVRDARISTLETARLDDDQLTADLLDLISEDVKLKCDNEDEVRENLATEASELREDPEEDNDN